MVSSLIKGWLDETISLGGGRWKNLIWSGITAPTRSKEVEGRWGKKLFYIKEACAKTRRCEKLQPCLVLPMGLTELVLTSLFYKGSLQWCIFWAVLGTKDRHTCQLVPDCHPAICQVPLMGSASLMLALMHLECCRETDSSLELRTQEGAKCLNRVEMSYVSKIWVQEVLKMYFKSPRDINH